MDDLRSNWRQVKGNAATEEQLRRMTKISCHPVLRRVRIKLLVETAACAVLLAVYRDWFDAGSKPLYAHLSLVIAVACYIAVNLTGYYSLWQHRNIGTTNLRAYAAGCLLRVKRLARCSAALSLLYGAALIVFFSSVIQLSTVKYLLLGGIVLCLGVITWLSVLNWRKWIRELAATVAAFQEGNA